MPYALYCDDARISKAYPTEASVWKHAYESGLVVEIGPDHGSANPRHILDNGYEIRACSAEAGDTSEYREEEAHAQRDDQLSRDAA